MKPLSFIKLLLEYYNILLIRHHDFSPIFMAILEFDDHLSLQKSQSPAGAACGLRL